MSHLNVQRMKKAIGTLIVPLIAFGMVFVPQVFADTWNQLTKVTFSAPVEIPGQVLPAGTYWFKLLDSPSNRNIVQIYNADQNKQLAMIMALPDYRLKPTGKTVITFEERAANTPPAIKAWFYPGDNYGQEFVYPKERAVQLAKTTHQEVPSMPANLEANTKTTNEQTAREMKKAPVVEEQPSGSETEIGKSVTTPPQLLAQNNPPPAEPASPAQNKLPSTASEMPLLALAGFVCVSLGFMLSFLIKRLN